MTATFRDTTLVPLLPAPVPVPDDERAQPIHTFGFVRRGGMFAVVVYVAGEPVLSGEPAGLPFVALLNAFRDVESYAMD